MNTFQILSQFILVIGNENNKTITIGSFQICFRTIQLFCNENNFKQQDELNLITMVALATSSCSKKSGLQSTTRVVGVTRCSVAEESHA